MIEMQSNCGVLTKLFKIKLDSVQSVNFDLYFLPLELGRPHVLALSVLPNYWAILAPYLSV